MKGAMADPPAKKIKLPKRSRVRIMGRSQYFFLTFMKPHKSCRKSMVISLRDWCGVP
jgi:hypothetical protein